MTWPPVPNTWEFELMKASFSAVVTILGLLLTWIIGQRLASRWIIWQKRREIELATTIKFYELVGEFLAVWRMWTSAKKDADTNNRNAVRWQLLERATAAEGSMEAICLKILVERKLSESEAHTLGVFRRLYQEAKYRILQQNTLDQVFEDQIYQTFKLYAVKVSCMLPVSSDSRPRASEAEVNLRQVTKVVRQEVHHLAKLVEPSPELGHLFPGNTIAARKGSENQPESEAG